VTRLKYNPAGYKRLAEIAGWLANGENAQVRPTGRDAKDFGRHWVSFDAAMGSIERLMKDGCEFRIKPAKKENDK